MVSFPNSLAGDYGFDPLGLGEDPESLRWYVQAELVHSRFAMLGVAGILLTDVSDSLTIFVAHLFFFETLWPIFWFHWLLDKLKTLGLFVYSTKLLFMKKGEN